MTSLILCAHDGAVATLTLNRPEKRNALNAEMWRGLSAHLRALATDSAVRCVVLQGADGHFAAGADMAEFAAHRATLPPGTLPLYDAGTAAIQKLSECSQKINDGVKSGDYS